MQSSILHFLCAIDYVNFKLSSSHTYLATAIAHLTMPVLRSADGFQDKYLGYVDATLCCLDNAYLKILNISSGLIEVCKHFLVGLCIYKGWIYALFLFIHYPNYTHVLPNASPGLIFLGVVFVRIFSLVYRGPIF